MRSNSAGQWRPSPDNLLRAQQLVRNNTVIDLHTHPQGIVPNVVRSLAERLAKVPHDPLDNLSKGDVDLAVVTVVGDPMGTIWRTGGAWKAVVGQLDAAVEESNNADVRILENRAPAVIECETGASAILGVEGADFIGEDINRLNFLHSRGVQVLGLVHYADNTIGTIGTSIVGGRGSRATRAARRTSGLSEHGHNVVSELNARGIVVDLAHADTATTIDACEISRAPVISSHTAAASIRDFPRYVSDEAIRAVASTGGAIGLWPARLRDLAMNDLDDFARHAAYIAELVGVEHISIGTDKNGVTAYADGYASSLDTVNLAAALLEIGFDERETAMILGGNARRILFGQSGETGGER